MISQVYGGGGNTGAPYQSDFIEVFNRLGSKANLEGYSVQYAAATSATWSVTPLAGTLQIGQYFLVLEGSGGAVGVALPTADSGGALNLSATAGKVALVSSTTPLSGTCPSGPGILDMVGYGTTANCSEGSVAPTPSNTVGVLRKAAGCTDTDSNSADFQASAPTPRNTASPLAPCAPVPSAPVLIGTSPSSPGTDTNPRVSGSADPGTTVEVFADSACSGSALASGSAAQFASPGISVPVAPDSSTTLYALVYDSSNTSACSAGSLTYVEDSTAPAPPLLSGTDPASPAHNGAPKINGSAEAGTSVKIYVNPACSGGPIASGSAASLSSPGIAVSVGPDSSTDFYATATDAAGNTSACSPSPLTYTEDSTAPPAPLLSGTSPTSPAHNSSPWVNGSAEAGATVRIYKGSGCFGAPLATGSSGDLGSSGIAVPVATDSSTDLYATATDAAGNTSPCSAAPLTYVEDSTPPQAPSLSGTDPASPANGTSPRLIGSTEPGTTIRIYAGSDCSGAPIAVGPASDLAAPGVGFPVAANAVTEIHATATDAAGNDSACAGPVFYEEDSEVPEAPVLSSTDPASPAADTSPKLIGSAEAGTTVRVYADSGCGGSVLATGSAADLSAPGIPVSVAPNSSTTLFANATDAAGNSSPCSATPLTYVEDSSSPDAPVLSGTDPASPAANSTPHVIGSAEAGTTVKIFTDPACSGSPAGSGSASELGSAGIEVQVPKDASTDLYATATDDAGNDSSCSAVALNYVEDSTPPSAPDLNATDPVSPAHHGFPRLIGSAEAGSWVRIYTDPGCLGPKIESGSEADLGSPGIQVAVEPDSSTGFYANATDAAGNTSDCSATPLTYVEDSTAPETAIDSGPGAQINTREAGFTFSSEPGAHFECALDGSGFFPCTSPYSRSFGDGHHTLWARAVDAAGNADPSPASWDFDVDTEAPHARIVYGPPRTMMTRRKSVRVRFIAVSEEHGSTLRCRLDRHPFADCPGTQVYRVKPGRHLFQVIAVDSAGNTDPAPSGKRFTVLRAKPRSR